MLQPATKTRLETLKGQLRKRGLARSVASESAILETLIRTADLDVIFEALSKKR